MARLGGDSGRMSRLDHPSVRFKLRWQFSRTAGPTGRALGGMSVYGPRVKRDLVKSRKAHLGESRGESEVVCTVTVVHIICRLHLVVVHVQ